MSERKLYLSLILAALLFSGRALGDEWECGTTPEDMEATRTTCEGTFKDRVVFVTFPDIFPPADSLLPSYADHLVADFKSLIELQAQDRHRLDIDIVKRIGADSIYVWVMPHATSHYTAGTYESRFLRDLNSMLPPGWNTDLDLPIYYIGAATPDFWAMGESRGRICSPGSNLLYIRYGYIQGSQYNKLPEHQMGATLVHEYGHQLGAGHLPDGRNGEQDSICNGPWWACYAAMDRQLMWGCDIDDYNGMVPYTPFNAVRFGWVSPQVVTQTTNDIRLRDVRLRQGAVKIPLSATPNEYFLIVNHQLTSYDEILNGRGLLIWHIREITGSYACGLSSREKHIIDLEHALGEFEPRGDNPFCPDLPHVVDQATGVDTLDCVSNMLPTAFYSGLAPCGGCAAKYFSETTNPWSKEYVTSADDRFDEQSVASGVSVKNIAALPDSFVSGKYMMEFDVIIQ